jgi:hypothetical protein
LKRKKKRAKVETPEYFSEYFTEELCERADG